MSKKIVNKLIEYVKANASGEFDANKEILGRMAPKVHKSKKDYNRKDNKNIQDGEE